MPKVTMDTIAAGLGISKNTVSRALRGLPGMSDDMRQRIIAFANENGYIMKLKESKLLHIVMIYRKSLTDDLIFWPTVLSGIMEHAADRGISIRALTVNTSSNSNGITLAIREQKCDGLLVVNDIEDSTLRQLAGMQLPMVVVDYYSESIECDYVNTANKNGIYKALSYLTANNHRRIGYIGNADRLFSFQERYEAYLYYMAEMHLPVDERFLWLEADYEDYSYFREKIEMLRSCDDAATAFLCDNDAMAAGFSITLGECGYAVPDDMSIIGFDNSTFPTGVSFTTLEVQRRALGQRALEQLILRIHSPEKPLETLHINTTLIIRDSVKRL